MLFKLDNIACHITEKRMSNPHLQMISVFFDHFYGYYFRVQIKFLKYFLHLLHDLWNA